MSHMVIFQTPDGNPGYNQFESVGEAVAFVETLRNDQGIENARMFALEEIKFELKPYFKVQMQALNPGAPSAPSAAPGPAPAAQPAPAPAAAPAPAPAAGEPTTFGTFAPPAPSPSPSPSPSATPSTESSPGAPTTPSTPSADQPAGEAQPARRGLFGR